MANDRIITPPFRASFVSVFKPRENKKEDGTSEFKYEIGLCLFKKGEDLSALNALVRQAAVKKWGDDQSKWPKPLRNPIRDQGEKQKLVDGKVVGLLDGCEEGAKFISIRSKDKPGLVDANRQAIIDDTEVYSGCWMRAQIDAFAYDKKGNRGVAFGLINVQKIRDDDPLGSGRMKAEDAFEAVAGADADAADPFGS
jgi:hypothetical protein